MTATWSFPFGTLRVWKRFLGKDPAGQADARRAGAAVAEAIREAGVPRLTGAAVLVGTGGSVRNLAKMDRYGRPYPIHRLHGYALGAGRLAALTESLAGKTLEERRASPGLNPDRADAIVAGAAVLQGLAECVGAEEILVSGQGIREGIIRRAATPTLPPPGEVRRASLRSIARRFARWDEERATHRAATAGTLQAALDPEMATDVREALMDGAYVLDIGTAIDFYNRHRQTAAILTVTDLNGFSHRDTALVAAVIRTAEKPKPGFRAYRPLIGRADAGALERAALILAIADEVERRAVPGKRPPIGCSVEAEQFLLSTRGEAPWTLAGLGDRFQKAFGRGLVVDGMRA